MAAKNRLLVAFGREIRRRRAALGMTLEVLGERAEITPHFIGGVELGRRNPSIVSCLSIARGLGVELAELLGGIEDLSPEGLEGARLFEALPKASRAAVLALLRGLAEA
jgi:transcriptional regulator with XRE-family HTH domain